MRSALSSVLTASCVGVLVLGGLVLGPAPPAVAGKPPAPAAAAPAAPAIEAWVLVRAGVKDVKMSGNTRDIRRARAQQQNGESLLYVRRAGKAYVIRDNGVLDRLELVWAPMDAQGKKMDALGKQMDPLGKQMDALGKRMDHAQGDAERESLSRQMDELGRQMDVLGKQMDALGKDMDKLAKKAEAELAVLVDDAIRAGKAIEVKAPI